MAPESNTASPFPHDVRGTLSAPFVLLNSECWISFENFFQKHQEFKNHVGINNLYSLVSEWGNSVSPVNGVLSSEMNLWSRILNWTTEGKGGIGPGVCRSRNYTFDIMFTMHCWQRRLRVGINSAALPCWIHFHKIISLCWVLAGSLELIGDSVNILLY